jgi:hypothetical protein
MGVPPMCATGGTPVKAGPKPALSEVEGMALRLMGKMPMLQNSLTGTLPRAAALRVFELANGP